MKFDCGPIRGSPVDTVVLAGDIVWLNVELGQALPAEIDII